ncbi:MAG: DUF3164 family protein [Sphingobacteriia bacterium]|nr:MAG: DUF3164 family protein [Sphingobacteriia bacterium]
MTTTIDLSKLTQEQLLELKNQVAEEQKKEESQKKAGRLLYKQMVSDEIVTLYPRLHLLSGMLSAIKQDIFDSLKTFIKMKSELYQATEEQNTHSFSTSDGQITIEIGYNVSDSWDDTVNTGITKVNEYMRSLVTDQPSKNLVDTIMKLLSKDNKGNLKASRVLQLRQMADNSGNTEFIDGMQIIQDAYRPTRSKEFVRCYYKGETGDKQVLPLSITEAPIIQVPNE